MLGCCILNVPIFLSLCSYTYKLTDFGAARELLPDENFFSVYGTEEYLVRLYMLLYHSECCNQ